MRYDAFISYRHSDLDMYVAKKIHKGLETFKVPRAVAKRVGKKNIKRVFRDQEELPIGSDLGDNIERALAESEHLLVICSPGTPESYWVQKEISTFIQMHGRERVLAVLVEGEPNQSFPEQLLIDDEGKPVEPLAADVRGSSKGEINKKLKTEIMRLAAPILNCSYDDLRQRHRERRMKRIAAVMAAVAVFAVAFGAYSAYNAAVIQENYEGKQRNQSKYLADTALNLLEEGDRRAAVLVALEALPSEDNDRPYVAKAQYALSEALYVYNTGRKMQMDRVLQHDMPVNEFVVSRDGSRVMSIDQGSYLYVWDINSGEKLVQFTPQISESGYVVRPEAVSVYGDSLIICVDDTLKAVGFDGQEQWNVEFEAGVTYCVIDEEAQMAACVNSTQVLFCDINTGEIVGNLQNSREDSFSSSMAFSADKTKFAVSHYQSNRDEGFGCVTIYDFQTKSSTDIDTYANYITDIAFTADNDLVVCEAFNKDFYSNTSNVVVGYLEKLDVRTQEAFWMDSFEYSYISNESASTQIKTRVYRDESTGETHDEIMMSVDNRAYTWDSTTGKRLAELQVDSGIATFAISTSSCFGFLAQYDGTVDIIDMTTGARYSSATIETGKMIRQLSIQNGVIVFRSYASPDLTVMKYPENEYAHELESYEYSIRSIHSSPDETYYAVQVYDFDVSSRVYFWSVDDHSFVREWVEEEGKYDSFTGFIDDDTYTVMYSDGTIVFYDVETGEEETLVLGENMYGVDYDINEANTHALAFHNGWYGIVDLKSKEVVADGEIEGSLRGAVLSDAGDRIFGSERDNGLCIIDAHSGKVTMVEAPGYQMLSGEELQDAFAMSSDGSLLAVACGDGMLRLLDTEALETVTEVPFTGFSRCFLKFTDGDSRLMMQGDDYYFRVYDLKNGEFCHIATEQCNEIENAVVDQETGIISIATSMNMLMLNVADFECSAQVEGGQVYLPEKGQILCNCNDTIYQFPYMTLEMLEKEAQEQFGGQELKAMEKIKYNVD